MEKVPPIVCTLSAIEDMEVEPIPMLPVTVTTLARQETVDDEVVIETLEMMVHGTQVGSHVPLKAPLTVQS